MTPVGKIPAWAWIGGLAVLAAFWLARSRSGPWAGEPPVQPGVTGTGDRTAQQPKARPWRG